MCETWKFKRVSEIRWEIIFDSLEAKFVKLFFIIRDSSQSSTHKVEKVLTTRLCVKSHYEYFIHNQDGLYTINQNANILWCCVTLLLDTSQTLWTFSWKIRNEMNCLSSYYHYHDICITMRAEWSGKIRENPFNVSIGKGVHENEIM